MKYDNRCRAMVGEAAGELEEDAGDLLDDSTAATSKNEQVIFYFPHLILS